MKLYWRYKKDGKWTWKPVTTKMNVEYMAGSDLFELKEEEE